MHDDVVERPASAARWSSMRSHAVPGRPRGSAPSTWRAGSRRRPDPRSGDRPARLRRDWNALAVTAPHLREHKLRQRAFTRPNLGTVVGGKSLADSGQPNGIHRTLEPSANSSSGCRKNQARAARKGLSRLPILSHRAREADKSSEGRFKSTSLQIRPGSMPTGRSGLARNDTHPSPRGQTSEK